jgi:hypothetical protein
MDLSEVAPFHIINGDEMPLRHLWIAGAFVHETKQIQTSSGGESF